jgi:glyoxylase-like metal-dependent hydrolase (beta-lactamase superfamily II)
MRKGSWYETRFGGVDRRNRAERSGSGVCFGAQQAIVGAGARPELTAAARGLLARRRARGNIVMKIAAALTALGALFAVPAALAQAAPDTELWRLDCGELEVSDFAEFSDSHRYDGKPYKLVDSCYLVRHGSDYLLWDTGLSGDILGKKVVDGVFTLTLRSRIVSQIAQIGVKPEQVRFVGISHRHFDHIGQVGDFPQATLLIGAGDFVSIKAGNPTAAGFKSWIDGTAKVEAVGVDKDVFGDGSVVLLGMPGHTPGHHSLLVRLKGAGPVLLSGDQFHATESFEHDQVPTYNTDRADTLASIDRFKQIAANLKATIVIQHEPADVAKLPAFPRSAR